MSTDVKQIVKAISITPDSEHGGWLLVMADKNAGPTQIAGFARVSDPHRLLSEIEKLAGGKISSDQNPLLLAAAADTSQVGFYPFVVPCVEGPTLEALITTQAETAIPMPLPQVAFTWRITGQEGETQIGYLAAVRKGYFLELSSLASGGVGSVIPDATGLVAGWSGFFDSTLDPTILIQVRKHSCILALCDQQKLVRATAIDSNGGPAHSLLHDVQMVIDDLDPEKKMKVFLTGNEETTAAVIKHLSAADRISRPWQILDSKVLSSNAGDYVSQLCECPQSFGTALAAIQDSYPEFDFIRRPKTQTSNSLVFDKRLLMRGLIAAVVMLIVCVMLKSWTAGNELEHIRQALSTEYQSTTGQKILARQELRERIVKQRPDMIEILSAISKSAENAITLDTFNFKKNQPVRITAKASTFEQVYQFQKKLQEQPGISNIKLISPTRDDRKNQVQFTMTFAYKNFAK